MHYLHHAVYVSVHNQDILILKLKYCLHVAVCETNVKNLNSEILAPKLGNYLSKNSVLKCVSKCLLFSI